MSMLIFFKAATEYDLVVELILGFTALPYSCKMVVKYVYSSTLRSILIRRNVSSEIEQKYIPSPIYYSKRHKNKNMTAKIIPQFSLLKQQPYSYP